MIRFYKKRWVFFTISIIIMLFGIIMMFVNGVNLDIQFTGGAILKYEYVGELNPDKAADIANALFDRAVTAQDMSDLASGQKRLVLNFSGHEGIESGMQDKLGEELKKAFPDSALNLWESSIVEPYFGRKFLQDSMTAIVLAFIMIIIYVWLRFRRIGGLSAGVMALTALFHDVAMVFFTFIIFRIPIGDSFIAVALTIIGYSINDTIVIYDRIRENTVLYKNMSIEELVDKSITQSIWRSVNTNVAVAIAIILVYSFAFAKSIESIQTFALPMIVGTISGCYSTICIAGPLWVSWKTRGGRGRGSSKSVKAKA